MTLGLLAFGSLLMATLAAIFAFLSFLKSRSKNPFDALTKIDAIQILRAETDTLKAAGDDQSRKLRLEINENLSAFQTNTVNVVSSLSNNITDKIRDFGERLDRSTKQIDVRIEGIGEKLNVDLAQLGIEANQNRDHLRKIVEDKLEDSITKQTSAARDFREELSASFQTLGGNVSTTLEQSNQQQRERLDNTKKAIEDLTEKHEKAQEALRQTVENRLDAIRLENASKLEEMRVTVDEKLQSTLESRFDQSFNRIVEQLSKVHEQMGEMKTLASNVGNLNNALSNVKIRGTFGEVQLALLIDEFLTPDQYVKNAQVKDDTAERVEYAIKFRIGSDGEELLLPVDAKFPREDYEHLIEASDAGDTPLLLKFRKQLENRIKACAKDIRDKYINPPRTTDFAILFLPTESLYAEVLRQPGLFEYLQRECHVTLAGPTTFSAILNAFRMNFHSLALAKQTSEIWRVLSAVRTEFGKYNKVVSTLDRQLRTASNSVESLGRRTKAMDRKLRIVETLPDDGSAEKLLGLTGGEIEFDDEEESTEGPSSVPSSDIVVDDDSLASPRG